LREFLLGLSSRPGTDHLAQVSVPIQCRQPLAN
jgi:hypothetical protein